MKLIYLLLILYLIHVYYQHKRKCIIRGVQKIDFSTVEEGDIIAFSGDHLYAWSNIFAYYICNIIQYFVCSNIITHYGLVVRYNNELYVLHLYSGIVYNHLYNEYTNGVNTLTPLKEIVDAYSGICFHLRNTSIDKNVLNSFALEYAKNKKLLTFDFKRWVIDGIFDTNMFKDNTDTCYEYIYNLFSAFTNHKQDYNALKNYQLEKFLIQLGYKSNGIIPNFYIQDILAKSD